AKDNAEVVGEAAVVILAIKPQNIAAVMSNDKCQMTNECSEIIVAETKPTKCPKCGGTNLEQDPDVFDTWFSSALWPFSTLGWPNQTKDLKSFYPTDVLVTGYDIITFWVSRMIMMGVHFMKKEPFHTVFIHGLVRDAKGKKMSKSFGNVIDPILIIDKIGADALRFALISLITGQGQDIKLTQDKITEARNFTNKIWNVTRFVLLNSSPLSPSLIKRGGGLASALAGGELADQWIVSKYQSLIVDVTKLLESYDLGEAARKIYDFLWGDFCDWYVEISKIDLYSEDEKRKERAQKVLLYVLEGTLRLLHPFMPFISEEIFAKLPDRRTAGPQDFILKQKWPEVDKKYANAKAESQMELLKEIITKIRNIKAEMGVQTKDIEIIFVAQKKGERETLKSGESFIKSLAKATQLTILDKLKDKPEQSATGVVSDIQFFIPLKGLIDITKEIERLKKEDQKIEEEVKRLKGLLSNKNFTSKAPPEAVEKQRARQAELEEKKKILSARLSDLA
ncbi:MAG: class I tRNA ligase family protein, partial [Candidatus Saganbacteria bacterium]|nr:class I tRNA ligase family protein [Candidatus Saganbacteria bacterium]